MLKDQGLKPHSALFWMGLALFAITRPGLSTARDVLPIVDSDGHAVPHTFLRPGEGTGCAAFTFRGDYRWICEDNPSGDDRNQPIFPDENGMYKFTVYYGWTGPLLGTPPDMDTPGFFAEYELVSHWDVLYTTRENCLASPPSTINGWAVPDSSYTVTPCPAKKYTGPPMLNPWAKDRQQVNPNQRGQAPAQDDLNAAATVGSSEFQLSSLPLDQGVVAPLGTDNTINSLPDNNRDTNAVAEISYPALNTPSLDTAQGGNVVAPSDSAQGYGFWEKEKRSSRVLNQRRRSG